MEYIIILKRLLFIINFKTHTVLKKLHNFAIQQIFQQMRVFLSSKFVIRL